MQLAWAWAYEEDQFDGQIPQPRRIKMPTEDGQPTFAPTWAEMDACIVACEDLAFRRRAIFLRFTGLRVQQAMLLKWTDIDLERGWIIIRGELGKSKQERRGRVIPMSEYLRVEMQTWDKDSKWVLPSGRTGETHRLARARDMARAWRRAGVRDQVWWQRPHHSFRKGFISGLKKAGADDEAVEFLVGHSLGLRGVYTDPDALPLKEAVGKIPPPTTASTDAENIVSLDEARKRLCVR